MRLENITTSQSKNKKGRKKQKGTASNDAETTDCDARDANGWMVCRNISSHHIPRYGNPIAMIGSSFTVYPQYRKSKFPYRIVKGCVIAVVRKPGEDDHFKFYDSIKFFERPPSDQSEAWCYLPCKQLMSLDKHVSNIKWDSRKRLSNKRPKKTSMQSEKGKTRKKV